MSEPLLTPSPNSWVVEIDGFDPLLERVVESVLAVSNGFVGTQTALPEGSRFSNPATFLAGVFEGPADPSGVRELVTAPNWLAARITVEGERLRLESGEVLNHRRWLDLKRGLVVRTWRQRDPSGRVTRLRYMHAASLADRDLLLQRLELTPENYSGRVEVLTTVDAEPGIGGGALTQGMAVADGLMTVTFRRSGTTLAFACASSLDPRAPETQQSALTAENQAGQYWSWPAILGESYQIEKLVVVSTSLQVSSPGQVAERRLEEVRARGSALLWREHEQAWSDRWHKSDIAVHGPVADQRALRFAVYHLTAAVNPNDPTVSVGARALTGESYRGHVFWDTEIFLLPFYCLTYPEAARALLLFRYRTLDAARAKAQRLGYRGALYAWEVADTGEEVTPNEVVAFDGEIVPIWTGRIAHHISADVAYAVWQYWQASGDDAFIRSQGAEMLFETARFWASRATREADGRFHIRDVVGPDEYHERVDDDAYTNGLARWNIQVALSLATELAERWPDDWRRLQASLGIDRAELKSWSRAADGLVLDVDRGSRLVEQFAGYHGLEEINLQSYEPRVVPMDVLLGRERIRGCKVLKQPDVLMLMYMLPDLFEEPVIQANYDYYDPRTGHGSSLSPGVHAALGARLGRLDAAMTYLRQTAAIDLDDRMGNAAGGVHIAALGSLWQAAVMGFGGVQVREHALALRPRLPGSWRSLCFPIQWRGRTIRVLALADPPATELYLDGGDPVLVTDPAGGEQALEASGSIRSSTLGGRWEIREAAR